MKGAGSTLDGSKVKVRPIAVLWENSKTTTQLQGSAQEKSELVLLRFICY